MKQAFRTVSAAVLVPVLLGLPGCRALRGISGLEAPSARVAGVRLEGLDLSSATLLFDVEVTNPYRVAIPLLALEYHLSSAGKEILSGRSDAAGSVPAGEARIHSLPARVIFADVLGLLPGIRPGQVVPYTARLEIRIDPPGTGPLQIPIVKEGELPIPAPPAVDLESVVWESFSLSRASALFNLRVVNRNEFPMDLVRLGYGITLADTPVIESALDSRKSFAPGGEQAIAIRASLSPSSLGAAALRMLSGAGASYRLGGVMSFRTPFGAIEVPYVKEGMTPASPR